MHLTLAPEDDIAAAVRGAGTAESLVLVIAVGRDALSLAQARAVIGPLAIERAPATRVNAVLPAADADPADVEAAAAWLEQAASTTGQLIEINAAHASGYTAPASR